MSVSTNPKARTAPRRRRRNREVRLEELYIAAARLFNERGFYGASLSDLAGKLGVTKAALYHYVEDKQDLLYRLHVISLQAAETAAQNAAQEGGTGIERLRLLIYNAICSSQTTCVVLEEDALKPEHREEIHAFRRRLEYGLRELVRSGIADGTIIPCDPKLATFVIVGAMNWVTKWYDPEGPWTAHQIADGISAMVARGLSTEPVTALPTDISRPTLTPFASPRQVETIPALAAEDPSQRPGTKRAHSTKRSVSSVQ